MKLKIALPCLLAVNLLLAVPMSSYAATPEGIAEMMKEGTGQDNPTQQEQSGKQESAGN